MPCQVKGSDRKRPRLKLQFATKYSEESFLCLVPNEWIHCCSPIIWWQGRGVGEVETVTPKSQQDSRYSPHGH